MVVKVRICPQAEQHQDITPGNLYRVIEMVPDHFRIMSDDGLPYLYPKELFDVVSDTMPEDWVVEEKIIDGERCVSAGPAVFQTPGFFERVFDRDPKAWGTLRVRLARWFRGEDYTINR
ncbi:MAG: hypothetical protein QM758_04475 [Armatimonas sp.]